jgi:hypothetical protein
MMNFAKLDAILLHYIRWIGYIMICYAWLS